MERLNDRVMDSANYAGPTPNSLARSDAAISVDGVQQSIADATIPGNGSKESTANRDASHEEVALPHHQKFPSWIQFLT